MSSDMKEWLDEAGGTADKYPAFRAANVGDLLDGIVVQIPSKPIERKNEMNGKMEKSLPISIEATKVKGTAGTAREHEEMKVGGTYTWWVKPGASARALNKALKDSNSDGVKVGDRLGVAHTELVDVGKPQPMKDFVAKHTPAKPTTSVSDLLGDDEPAESLL